MASNGVARAAADPKGGRGVVRKDGTPYGAPVLPVTLTAEGGLRHTDYGENHT